MARRNSKPKPQKSSRGSAVSAVVAIAVALLGGLIWLMQKEANDLERERTLRALPGGDRWLESEMAWVREGDRKEARAIWLGIIDEIVRTKPEVGKPELLALKMSGVEGIAGAVDRRRKALYVSARGFDFFQQGGLDEPLSGQRWLVATYENAHGQRHLFAALPAPLNEDAPDPLRE